MTTARARVGQLLTIASLLVFRAPCARSQAATIVAAGTVRDASTRLALPGAVLSALDAAGAAAGQGLADGDGRFRIVVAPTAVALRVRRIGFQPTTVDLRAYASRLTEIDVAMTRIAQRLAALRVSDATQCSATDGQHEAFDLWQQARDGLLAAVVARESAAADVETITFERTLGATDDLVVAQRQRRRIGRTTRAFVPLGTAQEFADRGYVRDDAGGRLFGAPDADVLFDERFATSHCFGIARTDSAHAGQIGLSFAPPRSRKDVVDVRGVLWIDRDSVALRSLDFRYTNLDREQMNAGAGGALVFETMRNGVVIIPRWWLRLPIFGASPPTRERPSTLSLVGIQETGGAVATAAWRDGIRWMLPTQTITGVVREAGARPVANVVVAIEGVDATRTDADGRFRLTPAIPGRYVVTAIDTSLDAFIAPRADSTLANVSASGASIDLALTIPNRQRALARLCTGRSLPSGTSVLLGRVRRDDGGPMEGLDVRATWLAGVPSGQGRTGAIVPVEPPHKGDRDQTGHFALCGVTADREISASVRHTAISMLDTTVRIAPDSLVRVVDFRVSLVTVADAARVGTARLVGVVVRDGSTTPVADAHVALPAIGREATADARGAFALDRLPAGTFDVEVRSVGNAIVRERVTLTGGATATVSLRAPSVGPRLDSVRVLAEGASAAPAAISATLQAFEARRAKGGTGRFITAEQLQRYEGNVSGALQRYLIGVRFVSLGNDTYLAATRSGSSKTGRALDVDLTGRDACWISIYLDGIPIYDGTVPGVSPPSMDRLQASHYAGVEFYAGASVPAEFNRTSTGCGTLLLWTRER